MKKTFKDIFKVTFSNFFVLLSGILAGFVIPKIMGVDNYGYYKTFGLYISYSSLFRFGIVDGIYLKFGGVDYNKLDKEKFRRYSQFIIFLESLLTIFLIMTSLLFLKGQYRYIFLFVSVYIWAFNVTSYYQIISQITSRFTELSLRNILQAIMQSISILIFWYLYYNNNYILDYKMYTLIYVGIQLLLSVWYIFTYHDITFGKKESIKNEFPAIIYFAKIGIPLLVANLCSTLILTIDRQFVNILFDNYTYAIYAFAYNMLSLITVATSAISTVIYPTLKKIDKSNLCKCYDKMITIILLFVFLMISIYFPLNKFIEICLTKYKDSLLIFKIIFPGLALSSAVSVVMHNYYKVLDDNINYFKKSLLVLLISFVANLLAYLIFKTTISISIASIITIFIWYLIMENNFIKKYNVKYRKNLLYSVLCMSAFYIISTFINIYLGFFLYLITIIILTLILFKKEIPEIIKIFKIKNN